MYYLEPTNTQQNVMTRINGNNTGVKKPIAYL